MYFSPMRTLTWICIGLLAQASLAADDILLFTDGDCEKEVGVPKWSASKSEPGLLETVPFQAAYSSGITLPLNCIDKYRGTSSVQFKLNTPVGTGWYNWQAKFPDDKFKLVSTDYKDFRFRVKNLDAKEIKLHPLVQNLSYSNTYAPHKTIAASADWVEVVIPLSEFTGFNFATDSIVGFGFGYNGADGDNASTGGAVNVLLEDMRITDGSGKAPLDAPALGGGTIPSPWPSHFVLGSLDNRNNPTQAEQAGEYRYNYIMPEEMVTPYWNMGTYIPGFMAKSKEFGVKPGFVWYVFGKKNEAAVASYLASATDMTNYVNKYEEFLGILKTELNAAPAMAPVILVLEPDTYGKLMQDHLGDRMDATLIPVNMDRANSVAGETFAPNLKGYAEYMVSRAKTVLGANNVVVGHLLNHWGVNIPDQIGQGRIEAHIMGGYAQGNFLNSMGTRGKGDVVFVEKTDRDAGVKLTEKEKEDWFWVDTNYNKYFAWVKCLSSRSNLRVVGWQVSEGSTHQTQRPKFEDDAIEYFLAHSADWAQAGFIGILFGGGLPGNANYPSDGPDGDGGWFVQVVNDYTANPLALNAVLGVRSPAPRRVPGLGMRFVRHPMQFEWSSSNQVSVQLMDLFGKVWVQQSGMSGSLQVPAQGAWIWRAQRGAQVETGTLFAK